MKEHYYTCIVCPEGCQVRVQRDVDGKIASVSGNKCKRGDVYVRREAVAPVRHISSTVAVKGGGVVPVKTSSPVPKEKIFDVMSAISSARASRPVLPGQIIIKNAAGTGADIIATARV